MDELQPTPMIQGEHVWLRAMESRDLETFARNRNDLEIGYVAGYYFPQSMTSLEKWYDNLMSDQVGKMASISPFAKKVVMNRLVLPGFGIWITTTAMRNSASFYLIQD